MKKVMALSLVLVILVCSMSVYAEELSSYEDVVLYEDFSTKPTFASENCTTDGDWLTVPEGGMFSDIKVPKNSSVEFDIKAPSGDTTLFSGIQFQMRKTAASTTDGYYFSYANYYNVKLNNGTTSWSTTNYTDGLRISKDSGGGNFFAGQAFQSGSYTSNNHANNNYGLNIPRHVKFETYEDKLIIYFTFGTAADSPLVKVYEVADNAYNRDGEDYYVSMRCLDDNNAETSLSFLIDNLLITKLYKNVAGEDYYSLSNDDFSTIPSYAFQLRNTVNGEQLANLPSAYVATPGYFAGKVLKPKNNTFTAEINTPKNYTMEFDLGYAANIAKNASAVPITAPGDRSVNSIRLDLRRKPSATGYRLYYYMYTDSDPSLNAGCFMLVPFSNDTTLGEVLDAAQYYPAQTNGSPMNYSTAFGLSETTSTHVKIEVNDASIKIYFGSAPAVTFTNTLYNSDQNTHEYCTRFNFKTAATGMTSLIMDNFSIKPIQSADSGLWLDEITIHKNSDGSTVNSVSSIEAGTYKLRTKAYNYNAAGDYTVMPIIALYKGNELTKVISSPTPLTITPNSTASPQLVEIPITISEEEINPGIKITGFVWNNLNDMQSLKAAEKLK